MKRSQKPIEQIGYISSELTVTSVHILLCGHYQPNLADRLINTSLAANKLLQNYLCTVFLPGDSRMVAIGSDAIT